MRQVEFCPAGIGPRIVLGGRASGSLFRPLAGGQQSFAAVGILSRDAGGTVTEQTRTLDAIAASSSPDGFADWLERVSAPRASVAGLAMDRPHLMGIVNVTPDSFSDGGLFARVEAAIAHGVALHEAGAGIVDVGGESTRPGSDPVSLDEELDRVIPVIEGLRERTGVVISIDTRKARVMREAIAAGADMINDVSALTHDPDALGVAADSNLPVVLMHARGDPKTMQDAPRYGHVLLDVHDFLEERIAASVAGGIARERLIVDPGIGFGKTVTHNLQLLQRLAMFHGLGVPVLLGASRKRFIGALSGEDVAARRVSGSLAAALAGLHQGAQILRVHDVTETAQALAVAGAILAAP